MSNEFDLARACFQGSCSPHAKLALFEEYLRQRTTSAAAPAWIPATVLWREIQEMGFTGCERTAAQLCCHIRGRLKGLENEPCLTP